MAYFYRVLYQRHITDADQAFLNRNGYSLIHLTAPPVEKNAVIVGTNEQLVTSDVDPAVNPAPSQAYAENWFSAQGPIPTKELLDRAAKAWSISGSRAARMYDIYTANMTALDGQAMDYAKEQLRSPHPDLLTIASDMTAKFEMSDSHAIHLIKRVQNKQHMEDIDPKHFPGRTDHMVDYAYTELQKGPTLVPLIKQEIMRKFVAGNKEADDVIQRALSRLSSSKQAAHSATKHVGQGPGEVSWNRMPGEQGVLTSLKPTGPTSVSKALDDGYIWFMVLSARYYITAVLRKNGQDLPVNSSSKATPGNVLQIDQSGVNDEDGNVRTVRLETPKQPDGSYFLPAGTYEIQLTSNHFSKTYTMVVA